MATSGLTTETARLYQKTHGYNEIVKQKERLLVKLARRSFTPISAMLLAASILSILSGRYFDGSFILFLLILNIGITVWQEHKADSAIEKLNENLASVVKVCRDGTWQMMNARLIVPKDLVELKAGDIVPADAIVIKAHSLQVNEAALTGESLPKEKNAGDKLYSGSHLSSGLATIEITAIGNDTHFGQTLGKVDTRQKKSALQKDILRISRFLSVLSLIAVAILSLVLVIGDTPWLDVLRLDLSLIIAGIPISLPTVMILIIAFGVVELSKKGVVVRRLSALEELANTELLLTDKTGTLTKNRITVTEVDCYGSWTRDEVLRFGAIVAGYEPEVGINQALLQKAAAVLPVEEVLYLPADSARKRSTLTFMEDGRPITIALGAAQVIEGLCRLSAKTAEKFKADVSEFADRGFRTLALAVAEGEAESKMDLAGVFALSDELREDAKEVMDFLHVNGIEIAMVTGDNQAIAREITAVLDIPGHDIITHDELAAQEWNSLTKDTFRNTRAFAEILPEDKYELVTRAKSLYTVAANGDGINDLPAVKAASVGFAVKEAVDALKSAADIVLLSDGIGVMKDAFLEGRKIFERLYSYSIYRISESFRLIVTIVFLGALTGMYPLSPLQLILLALLNDIPIISLAFDRVKIAHRPSKIQVREQFAQSLLFGLVGVVNSVLLYFAAVNYLQLPIEAVQTLFFLKLTVSGHLLIYVAHTKDRWYRYLPSKEVIIATSLTQAAATILALTGFLMPAAVSWQLVLGTWIWSFLFMQISESVKMFRSRSS